MARRKTAEQQGVVQDVIDLHRGGKTIREIVGILRARGLSASYGSIQRTLKEAQTAGDIRNYTARYGITRNLHPAEGDLLARVARELSLAFARGWHESRGQIENRLTGALTDEYPDALRVVLDVLASMESPDKGA